MERKNAWKSYSDEQLTQLEELASSYIDFISTCKTERECAARAIQLAEQAGYQSLEEAIQESQTLSADDKIWVSKDGKTVLLVQLGSEPLERGMNILGAHIDSPRLDLKQNPVYEAGGFALLDTHYYGGIKSYQWVTLPLALHGVVVKKDGSVIPIAVGESPDDPVFCVTDLLPHLASKQMEKKANDVIEGEALDVLVGSRPLVVKADKEKDVEGEGAEAVDESAVDESAVDESAKAAEKEPVKAFLLEYLRSSYGIEEEDFLSAEIEVVPAGRARECGFDRSLVMGYGQDDRVCAYTSLLAQLALANESISRTAVTILVDKEEIGSVGATGMGSCFFENAIAEIMALAGASDNLVLRRALAASSMLSSDVSAGFDPTYADVYETKNAAYLGRGLVFNKYTGARGKSGSNDASAEYMARVRRVMDDAGVFFQTAELGRVNAGGGGTIAYIPAKYGMNVIDSGVAVLSMHAPWEVTSKADIYEARRGYEAFLKNA